MLKGPDPFSADLTEGEQAEGARAWSELVAQRDKLSTRASWLAEHEGDSEWDKRAVVVTASRARFEAMLEGLAAWAGVGVGDVGGLLLEQEAVVEASA